MMYYVDIGDYSTKVSYFTKNSSAIVASKYRENSFPTLFLIKDGEITFGRDAITVHGMDEPYVLRRLVTHLAENKPFKIEGENEIDPHVAMAIFIKLLTQELKTDKITLVVPPWWKIYNKMIGKFQTAADLAGIALDFDDSFETIASFIDERGIDIGDKKILVIDSGATVTQGYQFTDNGENIQLHKYGCINIGGNDITQLIIDLLKKEFNGSPDQNIKDFMNELNGGEKQRFERFFFDSAEKCKENLRFDHPSPFKSEQTTKCSVKASLTLNKDDFKDLGKEITNFIEYFENNDIISCFGGNSLCFLFKDYFKANNFQFEVYTSNIRYKKTKDLIDASNTEYKFIPITKHNEQFNALADSITDIDIDEQEKETETAKQAPAEKQSEINQREPKSEATEQESAGEKANIERPEQDSATSELQKRYEEILDKHQNIMQKRKEDEYYQSILEMKDDIEIQLDTVFDAEELDNYKSKKSVSKYIEEVLIPLIVDMAIKKKYANIAKQSFERNSQFLFDMTYEEYSKIVEFIIDEKRNETIQKEEIRIATVYTDANSEEPKELNEQSRMPPKNRKKLVLSDSSSDDYESEHANSHTADKFDDVSKQNHANCSTPQRTKSDDVSKQNHANCSTPQRTKSEDASKPVQKKKKNSST